LELELSHDNVAFFIVKWPSGFCNCGSRCCAYYSGALPENCWWW